MSITQGACPITMAAGQNLNGDLHETLTVNSSGQVVKTANVTDAVVGILFADPGRTTAAGDAVTVMDVAAGGIGLVKAGAAITAGHWLVPHATDGTAAGVASPAALAAGQTSFGIALEAAGAAGQIIRFKAHTVGRSN